jgi:hypothetical protein
MAPLAIVAIFLVSKQALESFWYVLRVELPFYQRLGLLPLHKLLVLITTASLKTVALIAFAIAVIKRDLWNWEGKLLVVGILFGVASYLAQGKAFPYHRYPMLAFLFLWAGLRIITALTDQRGIVRALGIAGVGFAVILAPIYVSRADHKVWAPEFIDALSSDLHHLGGDQLSGHVQCIYTPADCDDTLYRMRLVQSTGLFYDYLIFGSDQERVIRDSRARFWQQFQSNPPQVIILGSGLFPDTSSYSMVATWPLFQQELATQYVLYTDRSFPPAESGHRAYRIYIQKDKYPGS